MNIDARISLGCFEESFAWKYENSEKREAKFTVKHVQNLDAHICEKS